MDTDLVTRAQGGDQEAFADLVYAVADRFLAVSHRILSDVGLAEDATQQALLSVWENLPQLRDPARFEAWSHRILVMEMRHAKDIRERFPAADEKVQLLGTFGGLVEIGDPYGSWVFTYRKRRDEIRACVEAFMDRLPPRPRR